jgi:hypothetical protein
MRASCRGAGRAAVLRLHQRRLERAHVDLGKWVALMDDLTFAIEHRINCPSTRVWTVTY